jgi:hypothetical protein
MSWVATPRRPRELQNSSLFSKINSSAEALPQYSSQFHRLCAGSALPVPPVCSARLPPLRSPRYGRWRDKAASSPFPDRPLSLPQPARQLHTYQHAAKYRQNAPGCVRSVHRDANWKRKTTSKMQFPQKKRINTLYSNDLARVVSLQEAGGIFYSIPESRMLYLRAQRFSEVVARG